jgi:hypothetical protein
MQEFDLFGGEGIAVDASVIDLPTEVVTRLVSVAPEFPMM